MRKGLLISTLLFAALLYAFASDAGAHATYTGYSGAPGSRGQCAYDCHPQADFAPTVTVTGFPATYTPGQQYVVAVAHQGGSSIMNFNASVRVGTGSSNGGTIAAGTNTSIYNITQETNGVHFTSSSQNSGNFTWTAPAAGTGAVRLYWAGLQGDLSTGADTQVVIMSNEGVQQDHAPVITSIPPQSVPEGGHLGVRVIATDQDGDPITLTAQQLPTHAAFTDSTGGRGGLRFDPDFTQSGSYQVRIIATAHTLADTEIVNITVTNVDRAPVITAIPPQTVPEGGHLGVRVTASDPDGDNIVLTAQQLPTHATFTDSTGGRGGLVFNPDTTQAGSYQVRIIATANALTDTEMVNITVTDLSIDHAPVITAVPPQTVAEGGHLAVRITATDQDGDPITLTAQQLPTHAAFTDSTGGRGGLRFDPDFTQSGSYQVRIIATAHTLADTEIVNITVTNVDRAPVITAIPPQTVPEGGHLGVRVTASDPDGDNIVLTAQQLPTHATFTDSTGGRGGLVFNPDTTQSGSYDVRIIAIANSMADSEMMHITVTDAGSFGSLTGLVASIHDGGEFDGEHYDEEEDDGGDDTPQRDGLEGVRVDLLDNSNNLVISAYTDQDGMYRMDNIPIGDYIASVQVPLGFSPASPINVPVAINVIEAEANFDMNVNTEGRLRDLSWWRYQVNQIHRGRNAAFTRAQAEGYADMIFQHFYDRTDGFAIEIAGATFVDGPPRSMSFDDLYSTLQSRDNSNIEKGKKYLLVILLDVVTGRLSQTSIISYDGATVSQAIIYLSGLYMTGEPTNVGIAATNFNKIQSGLMVSRGVIPLSTPNIMYKPEGNESLLPSGIALNQNYPNPFNAKTVIQFSLSEAGHVTIDIFDMLGRKVTNLVDESYEAGIHRVTWNSNGNPSGTYIYRIRAGSYSETKRMVVQK